MIYKYFVPSGLSNLSSDLMWTNQRSGETNSSHVLGGGKDDGRFTLKVGETKLLNMKKYK